MGLRYYYKLGEHFRVPTQHSNHQMSFCFLFRTGVHINLYSASMGKLFTHMCLFTKQYNLVRVKQRRCPAAGKVTVGLALHWPCVTDFSGLSTYKLMT